MADDGGFDSLPGLHERLTLTHTHPHGKLNPMDDRIALLRAFREIAAHAYDNAQHDRYETATIFAALILS